MREHLFRGFHPNKNGTTAITLNGKKIKGEWIVGDCIHKSYPNIMEDTWTEEWYIRPLDYIDAYHFHVLPETVCEYTGLTDKNGKKIFEGHTCTDGQNLYEIVFDRYQFAVKVIKTQLSIMQKGDIFPLWQFDNCERNGFRKLEIIGDIYNTTEGI